MTFCLFELIVLQRARPFPAPLRLWPTCAAGGVWRPLCGSRAADWAWSRTPTGSRPRAPSRCSPPAQLHRERGGEWLRWWDHSAAANVLSNKELSQKINVYHVLTLKNMVLIHKWGLCFAKTCFHCKCQKKQKNLLCQTPSECEYLNALADY